MQTSILVAPLSRAPGPSPVVNTAVPRARAALSLSTLSSHLVEEVDALREQEERIDEHHPDLVEQASLGDRIEDHAVTRDQRRREHRVLLFLKAERPRFSRVTHSTVQHRTNR